MIMTLLQDIVIPKGTEFMTAPTRSVRVGKGYVETVFGLSKNTSGSLVYYVGDDADAMSQWFKEMK